MIITSMNLLGIPLVFALWAMDSVLFLAFSRVGFGRLESVRSTKAYQSLCYLTDPLPRLAEKLLAKRREGPIPQWASWSSAILGLMACRYLLVLILISFA